MSSLTTRKGRVTVLFLLIALCLMPVAAQSGQIQYRSLGFSIDTFDVNALPSGQAVLFMFLAASEGFAPNVSVILQDFPGDLSEYRKVSEEELSGLEHTMLRAEQIDDRLMMEYRATQSGRALHFYQVAHKQGDKVYLITGTALDSQWESVSSNIYAVADSFALMPWQELTLNVPEK